MNFKPNFLVLSGDGINCERETAAAFEESGATSTIVHINDLLESKTRLNQFDGLALPGGFSFGDELGSGQILSMKIKHGLSDEFKSFVESKKPIIGICNGFQVLVKLGALPSFEREREIALAHNISGEFINKWSKMKVNKSVCKWTHDISEAEIELPVRHAEGRIIFKQGQEVSIYNRLIKNGQIPFTYTEDINGSYERIAGVCDESGMILGLMPHPEAYLYKATYRKHCNDVHSKGDGILLFENIVNYLKQS